MKKKKKGYQFTLVLTIIWTIAAINTLIPSVSASKMCFLGYKAHCTFTPISTLICIIVAGLFCFIRRAKYTE